MQDWTRPKERLPETLEEVLILVDGHRGPSWRNSFPLVAYLGEDGLWYQERHEMADPLPTAFILAWHPITYPSPL